MPDLISPYDMVPVDDPVPEEAAMADPVGGDGGADAAESAIEAVRELVLRAHPDIVPELVAGDTIADLIASVEPAREAYARLASSIPAARAATSAVPAGGGVPIPVDPDRLPASEKIRRGLAAGTAFSKKG